MLRFALFTILIFLLALPVTAQTPTLGMQVQEAFVDGNTDLALDLAVQALRAEPDNLARYLHLIAVLDEDNRLAWLKMFYLGDEWVNVLNMPMYFAPTEPNRVSFPLIAEDFIALARLYHSEDWPEAITAAYQDYLGAPPRYAAPFAYLQGLLASRLYEMDWSMTVDIQEEFGVNSYGELAEVAFYSAAYGANCNPIPKLTLERWLQTHPEFDPYGNGAPEDFVDPDRTSRDFRCVALVAATMGDIPTK
jgi:hypothetical protein